MQAAGLSRVTAVALALAGAAASCSSGPAPTHHRLEVQGMAFQPGELVVAPGDTLTWTNRDVVPHTVTALGGGWSSGELREGGTFTMVPDGPDTLRYECAYHPTMRGAIVVR